MTNQSGGLATVSREHPHLHCNRHDDFCEHKMGRSNDQNYRNASYHYRVRMSYFFNNHKITETMMLIMIIVVIGTYTLSPGLLMMISPGSRPIGSLPNQGHRIPMMINRTPAMITAFCICFTSDRERYDPQSVRMLIIKDCHNGSEKFFLSEAFLCHGGISFLPDGQWQSWPPLTGGKAGQVPGQ